MSVGEVLGFLLGWPLTAYLVWRAWGGIRSDWARLRRHLPRFGLERRGRYSGAGRFSRKDGLL